MSKCPLCDRQLIGTNEDRHHLIPIVKGGKQIEPILIHQSCHRMIHATFSEWELMHYYHTWDRLKENEKIQKFIKWIQKKPLDWNDSFKQSKTRH